MTKSEKLYAAFRYVQNTFSEHSPRVPHYTGEDWPIIYANDMFVDDGGNCCSYAAAFGYMAAAIGYDTVYCCNSGGHGWTEIDGKIYGAFTPYTEEDEIEGDVEFIILEIIDDEDGEQCTLKTVDDEELYTKIGDEFMKLFTEEFDEE